MERSCVGRKNPEKLSWAHKDFSLASPLHKSYSKEKPDSKLRGCHWQLSHLNSNPNTDDSDHSQIQKNWPNTTRKKVCQTHGVHLIHDAFVTKKPKTISVKLISDTRSWIYYPESLSAKPQNPFYKSHITYKENKLLFRLWDFPGGPNLKLFIDVLLICFPCVNTLLRVVPSPNTRKTILNRI